jgi:recombination protein RecT
MASTAVQKKPLAVLIKEESMQKRIAEVLGDRAPQFASSLVSLANANQRLQEADPQSVIAAAMTAALLNLPINKDLGFAHIVPYSGVAQFQMGYKGFIQLAMRTGQYKHLNACAVREGEFVSYSKLSGELILNEGQCDPDSLPVGYAAYMKLINGFEHAIYWTKEEVWAHAQKYSQAVKSKKKDSPWFTNFDSMALKTVIKSLLSKWGILSIELETAFTSDGGFIREVGGRTEFESREPIKMPRAIGEEDGEVVADAISTADEALVTGL